MLATLLLATLVVAGPPISVRLSNDGRYAPGDAVRVTVRPDGDGYLLVLHADPDGRVRVLFPLDPTDDAFVRGGRDYDLRTRGDRRDLFIADWNRGQGTILAALSSGPLLVDPFTLNGHWDYRTLNLDQSLDDESALRDIATRMAPIGMKYDVAPYVIGDAGASGYALADGGTVVALGVGGCWACGVGWYDPWWGWGWGAPGWGWGWNVGWGWGVPGWGWGWGWGVNVGWGWGWGAPGWGWGAPGWGWGAPGWGAPGWPANGFPSRTWGGQPHPGGGGVGVQSGYRFNQSVASNGGVGAGPGYRNRGAGSDIGVQAAFSRPEGTYNGRRTEAGAVASRGTTGRRTEGAAVASNSAARSATGNTGRRSEGGAAMPRDVSRGYTGADAPTAVTYDRGAVRRRAEGTSSSQVMPRDSRVDVNGTYARPSTDATYGRRSYGGDVSSSSRSGSYERTRPQSTYDRGRSAYQPRSGSAGGYGGRSAVSPRSGTSGGYGGAARAPSGGGGSRGFSGGGGGGARGGGYRGR